MKQCKVIILPKGNEVKVQEGTSLIKVLKESQIQLDFPCGGIGKCGKCRVRIVKGNVKINDEEKNFLQDKEMEQGIHLACFIQIYGDVVVEIIEQRNSHYNILLFNQDRQVKIQPHISKKYIEIKKPSLKEHTSDWKRLCDSLIHENSQFKSLQGSIQLLKKLPETIRESKYNLTAVTYGCEVLEVEASDTTQKILGMAFDIGTTTLVGYLVDLTTGKELIAVSALNPQVKYGADIITRINFATQGQREINILQLEIIKSINNLIIEATQKAKVDAKDVYIITVVGNTCMHHLFLGLNPRYIGQSPYISVINEAVVLNSADLNIEINKSGKVLVFPNIAGFVGGDTVAVLLATEMDTSEDFKLVIDIGTNGEIILGRKGRLVVCSTAAGPAFEGAQISSGMRGTVGAISHISFNNTLNYSVIGNVKPKGICGSGLLDGVAGLLELELIDQKGNFVDPEQIKNTKGQVFKKNIIEYEGGKAFLLVDEKNTFHKRPIVITQKDIRQLQLAKGAIAAGIQILFEKQGITLGDVKEVLLAGAFGNYLNPHSACIIGLIPKELKDRVKMVGNAAGSGAKLALVSVSEYKRAIAIAESTEYVELASYPKFASIFAQAICF